VLKDDLIAQQLGLTRWDTDYFKFTAVAHQTYNFTCPDVKDGWLFLYREDTTTIINTLYFSGSDWLCPADGTYYFRIANKPLGGWEDSKYTITFRRIDRTR
jgi:hypothetical protein